MAERGYDCFRRVLGSGSAIQVTRKNLTNTSTDRHSTGVPNQPVYSGFISQEKRYEQTLWNSNLIYSGLLILGQVLFTTPGLVYNPAPGSRYFIYCIADLPVLWACLFLLTKCGWEIIKGKVKIEALIHRCKKFIFYIGTTFLIASLIIILLGSLIVLLPGCVGVGIGVGFAVYDNNSDRVTKDGISTHDYETINKCISNLYIN